MRGRLFKDYLTKEKKEKVESPQMARFAACILAYITNLSLRGTRRYFWYICQQIIRIAVSPRELWR